MPPARLLALRAAAMRTMAVGASLARSGSLLRAMCRSAVAFRRDRQADELLDRAQIRRLLGVAQRDRDAGRAGARGAADAVHIALRLVRQVVVDDMTDAVD